MGLGTSNIWSSNWLIAAAYCVLFTLLAAFPFHNSLQNAESDLLTQAMNWTSKTPSGELAIISIDQKSLDNVGPWPWQRSVLAQVIARLADSGARAHASTPGHTRNPRPTCLCICPVPFRPLVTECR